MSSDTNSVTASKIDFNDQNSLAVKESVPSLIPFETLAKVRDLIEKSKKNDEFNGCLFDFSQIPNFSEKNKQELKAVKVVFPTLLEKQADKHVVALKLQSTQTRIANYATELGFSFHNADSEGMLMTRCMIGHEVLECSYPKFTTVSVGVTGVVFDEQLENVILIQEKWGGLKNMKPPTGGVDYLEENESPLDAVVRELEEEGNIKVDRSKAVLVGNAWTQQLRGKNPDTNYIFAFRVSKDVELKPQEDEITQVSWVPVKDYIKEDPEEANQPWVMKRIVAAAQLALLNQKEWIPQNLYWVNSKPVTLFCFHPKF